MRAIRSGIAALALAALLAAPLGAQQAVQRVPLAERFKQLDRNGDGKLGPEEVGAPRLFQAADADKDGFVSPEELTALSKRLAEPRQAMPMPPENASFAQTTHTLTVDGRERAFVVQTPKQPKGAMPVVFFFHGGGGRGENLAAKGFGEMVAKENFLAVYPSGWKNNWNDGRQAPRIASQVENVDDVKFVRAIVDDLETRHPIDRSRIFATGASNGGIFSHYLAAKAADLFAGIAPVIGGLAEPVAEDFAPGRPISLLVIQGGADPLVPVGGGPIAGWTRGGHGQIIATEAMLKKYVAHNGIAGAPTEEPLPDRDPNDGTTTRVRRYPPGKEGAKVEYWLIDGGGHTMPGRELLAADLEAFVGKTGRDFDGLEVIWQFFKTCPPRVQTSASPQSAASPAHAAQP